MGLSHVKLRVAARTLPREPPRRAEAGGFCVPASARRAASALSASSSVAPPARVTVSNAGLLLTTVPTSATPAAISTSSEAVQMAKTVPTCSRRAPCRRTYAFCAPMATISERLKSETGDESGGVHPRSNASPPRSAPRPRSRCIRQQDGKPALAERDATEAATAPAVPAPSQPTTTRTSGRCVGHSPRFRSPPNRASRATIAFRESDRPDAPRAGDACGDDPVVRRLAWPVTAAGDRKVVNPIALRCSACEWKRPPRPRTLLGVAPLAGRTVK